MIARAGTDRGRWATVAFVGALALCLPAWHVVSALLSDSYMTLYAGRFIAAHGIPHHEVFTLGAAGRPWVDQQWLAELIDYEAWRSGGYGALGLLNGVVIAGAFAGLAGIVVRRGAGVAVAVACCILAAAMALPGMFIRAQDLALPLFVIVLGLCLRDAEAPVPMAVPLPAPAWRIVLVLPVLVLWANLHGSVLLGAGLVFLFLVYRGCVMASRGARGAARRYWVLAGLAVLTPLLTPYGIHILSYYRELIGNPGVAASAPENRPPSLSDPQTILFLLPLVLGFVTVTAGAVRGVRVSPPLLGAAVITAAATVYASRNVVWFGMTVAVLLASSTQAWVPTKAPTRGFLIGLAGASAAIAVLGVALLLAPAGGGYERYTPLTAISAAARDADDHPAAHILGDNAAASALLWHEPQLAGRVAYDARLERYTTRELDGWIVYQTGSGPGWPATTRGYQILLGSAKYNPALTRRLASLPGARVLGGDPHGIAVLNP